MIRHNCGLVVTHSLHDAYSFLKSLQHRGREAAGIAAIGDKGITVLKWKGRVNDFDITDLYKIFHGNSHHTFLGHVRYATRGRKEEILEDAHPHTIGGVVENRISHIIIRGCEMAAVHNGQVDSEYYSEIDNNLLKTGCDTEALLHLLKEGGFNEHEFLRLIPGAYTFAYADSKRKEVLVFRDATGIKPGVLGWKDGKYCVASEDVALVKNGSNYVEDLMPGFIYYLLPDGGYRKEKALNPRLQECFFEWNYIANVNSVLNGISVRQIRQLLGEELAVEFKPAVDVVSFLPRCPEVAAQSYAAARNLPFMNIFYKMRDERAFQGSTKDDRWASIQKNLYVLPAIQSYLKDKTILLIDDSTIRGNNARWVKILLYDVCKVKKAYLVNYTPKIGIIGSDNIPRGCVFGVDMPPDDNFVARNRTDSEISKELGLETYFLSVEGMKKAYAKAGFPSNNLCTYCIGGKHPFT